MAAKRNEKTKTAVSEFDIKQSPAEYNTPLSVKIKIDKTPEGCCFSRCCMLQAQPPQVYGPEQFPVQA